MRDVDTISLHRAVIEEHGFVWWGKFGLGASQTIVQRSKDQITAGNTTLALLVNGRKYAFVGTISDVAGGGQNEAITSPDLDRTPKYYRNKRCSLWLKLTAIQEISDEMVYTIRMFNDPSSRPDLNSSRGLMYITFLEQHQG